MKFSWDDDIPNIWKVIKFMFQTTNQLLGYFSGVYQPKNLTTFYWSLPNNRFGTRLG